MLYGPDNRLIESHSTGKPSSFWQAFEGAKYGGYRGWWFFPTLDTSAQMPRYTREQIAKKSNWCYNNMGDARALIDGLALDEVDTAIWPKWVTSNPAFNKAVTDRFHEESKDARYFDLRRNENFYTAQFLIRRSIYLHGNLFGQLVRPATDTAPARIGFIPDYQCVSDIDGDDPTMRDGIRFDPQTSAVTSYRFAKKSPDAAGNDDTNYVDLPADDVLHFHDPFWPDQIRGMGILAPVVRKMFSMDDISNAETSGQIMRSRLAYAITRGPQSEDAGDMLLPGATATEQVTNPDGTKLFVQKFVSRDTSEVDVAQPPAGYDIKMLESQRGGSIEFHDFLRRDVATATLYPPEWVFFMMGAGTGPITRLIQGRAQRVMNFKRNNQIQPQFCARWCTYWVWQRIKAGIFDKVTGGVPQDWYAHKLINPANMTIDLGREGRLFDDRYMRGNMSPEDYHGQSGHDAGDVEDEVIAAAIRRRKKLVEALEANPGVDLQYNEVFLLPPGTANTAATVESGDDEPVDPPPEPAKPAKKK